MEGSRGTCGGNRRRFLKTAAATGGGGDRLDRPGRGRAAAPTFPSSRSARPARRSPSSAWGQAGPSTRASSSRARRRRPLHRHLGGYENGKSPRRPSARSWNGPASARTSTSSPRTQGHRKARRPRRPRSSRPPERQPGTAPTDYVDCYYIHGITGKRDRRCSATPSVKAAFEGMKKSGKIRFCGLSCHDGRLPEILEAAAEVRLARPDHDQVQLPRPTDDDEVQPRRRQGLEGQPRHRRDEDPGGRRPASRKPRSRPRPTSSSAKGFKKEVARSRPSYRRTDAGRRQRDDQPRRAPREHRPPAATR